MVTLVLLIITLILALCMWIKICHNYWSRKNILQVPTTLFGGNVGEAMKLKKNLADIYADIYRQYDKYPFVGIYKIFTPCLLIRDPELIKLILINEFSNFYNNTITFDEADPITGKNPFVLNGEKWKTFRAQLTPLFTTAKVKSAISVFNDSAQKMVDYIEKSKQKDLDGRDVAMRYTTENVVSFTLGLEAKCFVDDNSEFKKIAIELFGNSILQELMFYIAMVFPTITKYFKLRLASSSTENRFKSVVSQSVDYRLRNEITRNDLLSSLILMKNAGTFSDHDISVTIGAFYIDGVETSSTVLNYFLYDLAAHPSAQEELKKEIDTVMLSSDRTVTYEVMQSMVYLDAAFNESLRLHTPVPFFDKQITRRTTLNAKTTDGKPIKVSLDVGTSVIIPLRGLQLDEKFFPDPFAFKPERFLPKNKQTIPKFAFLPFGEGPRICLGKRFGTTQVKIAIIHIVRNYKLILGCNTPYPTDIDPKVFILRPKQAIRIEFQQRK